MKGGIFYFSTMNGIILAVKKLKDTITYFKITNMHQSWAK